MAMRLKLRRADCRAIRNSAATIPLGLAKENLIHAAEEYAAEDLVSEVP
jgi:hypothetical protein